MAYCSTSETHWDLGRQSYLKLEAYRDRARFPIQILSEKIRPELCRRPRWQELLALVTSGKVKIFIVPNLFHIAGSNVAELSDFLLLLEKHEVKLITLDVRDSVPLSRSQTLIQFVNGQFKSNERR
jgi:DNA invertase Pin-like site-specific DNA recombinase